LNPEHGTAAKRDPDSVLSEIIQMPRAVDPPPPPKPSSVKSYPAPIQELKRQVRRRVENVAREEIEPVEALVQALTERVGARDALLARLQARIQDVEASVGQIHSLIRREGDIPLPPPKHLQFRSVGSYVPGFFETGFAICNEVDSALGAAGKGLGDFQRILDWGCGAGRITRALRFRNPSAELF